MNKFTFSVVVLAVALGLVWNFLLIPRTFQLHVLDIGQGDAILLETPSGERILVDGGPGQAVLEELGEVMPIWDRRIDLLVLTHPHEDHVAGLVPVIQRFDVRGVLLSAPTYDNDAYAALLSEVQERQIPYFMADDDEDFNFSELKLDVLFPFEPTTGDMLENVNNASVVMKAIYGETSILLTGDAEQEVEAALLASGADLEADILKAGHHGSRSSSTLEFLEAVEPELMLISCGVGNTYEHPHPETLEKAANLGIEVLRTDLEGRISIGFGDQSFLRSIFAPRLRSFSSSRS